jgi:type I restriction enzyme S subunit
MAAVRCAIGRGVAAIRHKSRSRSYTYYAVTALREVFATFEGGGTVFGAINKDAFLSMKTVIPNPAVIRAYENAARSLDQAIEKNGKQSLTLAAIRDALLPKLISGEIRIKDAEQIVGEKV